MTIQNFYYDPILGLTTWKFEEPLPVESPRSKKRNRATNYNKK